MIPVSAKLAAAPRKTVSGAAARAARRERCTTTVSVLEVDLQRRSFRPAPGLTETSLRTGAVLSILTVTVTVCENDGDRLVVAVHLIVLPWVSPRSTCGPQPSEFLIPS